MWMRLLSSWYLPEARPLPHSGLAVSCVARGPGNTQLQDFAQSPFSCQAGSEWLCSVPSTSPSCETVRSALVTQHLWQKRSWRGLPRAAQGLQRVGVSVAGSYQCHAPLQPARPLCWAVAQEPRPVQPSGDTVCGESCSEMRWCLTGMHLRKSPLQPLHRDYPEHQYIFPSL